MRYEIIPLFYSEGKELASPIYGIHRIGDSEYGIDMVGPDKEQAMATLDAMNAPTYTLLERVFWPWLSKQIS